MIPPPCRSALWTQEQWNRIMGWNLWDSEVKSTTLPWVVQAAHAVRVAKGWLSDQSLMAHHSLQCWFDSVFGTTYHATPYKVPLSVPISCDSLHETKIKAMMWPFKIFIKLRAKLFSTESIFLLMNSKMNINIWSLNFKSMKFQFVYILTNLLWVHFTLS